MDTTDGDLEVEAERWAAPRRWVCRCSAPPVLLATVEGDMVNLKIRDRYYHIECARGRLRAICPRCGKEHLLALGGGGRGE